MVEQCLHDSKRFRPHNVDIHYYYVNESKAFWLFFIESYDLKTLLVTIYYYDAYFADSMTSKTFLSLP